MSSNPFINKQKRLSEPTDPVAEQINVVEPTPVEVPTDYVNKLHTDDIVQWDDEPVHEPEPISIPSTKEQLSQLINTVEDDTLFTNVYNDRKEPSVDKTTTSKPVIEYLDSTKPIGGLVEQDTVDDVLFEEDIIVVPEVLAVPVERVDAIDVVDDELVEEEQLPVSVTDASGNSIVIGTITSEALSKLEQVEDTQVKDTTTPISHLSTDTTSTVEVDAEPVVESKQKLFKHIDVPVEEESIIADTTEGTDDESTDPEIQILAVDSTYKDLMEKFTKLADNISKKYDLNNEADAEEFSNELDDVEGLAYKLRRLLGASSAYRDLDHRAFQKHDVEKLLDITSNIRPKNASSKLVFKGDNPTKILDDKEARAFLFAKMRGAKKVFLTSSGFYVYVRPLTNLEISELISTISNEDRDYGRQLGGHFYLFNSMHIKQFFANKIVDIVSECNLQGWRRGTTLVDNISLQDYKSILWACACGMYKDGVKFTKICAFCGHEEELLMNVDKLFFQNERPLLEGALKVIEGKQSITPKDAAAYREAIVYSVDNVIDVPGFKVHLKVPTITDYLNYAVSFINTMVSEIRDLNNSEAIKDYIRYTFYKQYAPWVSSIDMVDEHGELEGRMVTEGAIVDFFKLVSLEDTSFGKEMEEYITATMLTFIAFNYIECPSCHKVPEDITNGFVAYDIESGFFTMSVKKLRDLNSRITD